MVREEGKLDLVSMSEDNFHDGLGIPPTAAELLSNAHSSRSDRRSHPLPPRVPRKTNRSFSLSRSTSACVSPLADAEAGNVVYGFNKAQ